MTHPADTQMRECPFCSGEASWCDCGDPLCHYIECKKCKMQINLVSDAANEAETHGDLRREMIKAWNTRAQEAVEDARDAAYWKDRAHAAEDKITSQPLMDVCRQCDECAPYLKEHETPVQRIERERKDVTACLRLLEIERTLTDIERLVDRFLAWPLPSSVCPDGCVMNRDYPYRIGTHLLTAEEAKAMFIHALGRDAAMAARGGS